MVMQALAFLGQFRITRSILQRAYRMRYGISAVALIAVLSLAQGLVAKV